MSHLTSPLDLRAHLNKPDLRLDCVPFIDCLLIGLCFLALGSSFIAAPGEVVDLPRGEPSVAVAVVDVLTIKHDNMLLYGGRIYTFDELARFFQRTTFTEGDGGVLLVKTNRDVSMQTFLNVCAIARNRGFERVQIATEAPANIQKTW